MKEIKVLEGKVVAPEGMKVLNKLQNPDNVSASIKKKMAVSLMLHLESICESSKKMSRYSLTVLKLSLKKSGNLILI